MKRSTLVALILVTATACGPKRVALPTGPGTPAPEARAAFDEASRACRAVRTIRATLALSGRAGSQKMRGTLIGGLEAPDALRLEGVAPFGPPVFILAARAGSATLLLPRDNRVLTGVTGADILEALAGVRLAPSALRAILTGCLDPSPQPGEGRTFANGWIAIDVGSDITAFMRRIGAQWRMVAGLLPALEVQYSDFVNGLPGQVQIRSRADRPSAVAVDLALRLSDVATNVDLNPAAFKVDVPRDAVAMTLAELRDAGPLGEKR